MSLSGKRVLITGAARGVGAGTARQLAKRGARVALVGLEPKLLAEVAKELGPGHVWFEADVTDQEALTTAIDAAAKEFGGLDAVVANAGIASFGPVGTIDPEAWLRTVDINLNGVYRTAHAAAGHLAASKGYFLVVSSLAAFVPTMGFSAYGASKSGVEAFANALAIEWAHKGIDVGCAHMSWIDTDLVRDAQHEVSTFNTMLQKLPWPMHSITSLDACVAAFVRGIDKRQRRIYVPLSVGLMNAIRPITHSPLVELVMKRMAGPIMPKLEEEIRALGRSVSARLTEISQPKPATTPAPPQRPHQENPRRQLGSTHPAHPPLGANLR